MTEQVRPKFTLAAEASFAIDVLIPRLGLPDAEIKITYKARSPQEMIALDQKFREEKTDDVTAVLAVATGWELPDAFNAEALKDVQTKHPGFAGAVVKAYFREFERVRLGN